LYLYSLKGRKSLVETQKTLYLLSFFLTLLFAISDEYHQSFTPDWHSPGKDVFIDVCGALTVLVILNILKTRKKWKHEGEYCNGKTVDY
jgi:VanZ family protein